jgi:hypothetical protein
MLGSAHLKFSEIVCLIAKSIHFTGNVIIKRFRFGFYRNIPYRTMQ